MRLDRFLHCIRLVKSRTLAQALVEEGHVRVDGKRALKASEPVHEGAVLTVPIHGRIRVLRVLSLPDRRGPAAEARCHYEELGPPSGD